MNQERAMRIGSCIWREKVFTLHAVPDQASGESELYGMLTYIKDEMIWILQL